MRDERKQIIDSAQALRQASGASMLVLNNSSMPLSSMPLDLIKPPLIPSAFKIPIDPQIPIDPIEIVPLSDCRLGTGKFIEFEIKHENAATSEVAVRCQYQPGDVKFIRDATRLSAKFFADKRDTIWEDRQLRLCNHAFDIGLILSLAGESKNLIVAGILSSSLQETLKEDRAQVKETIKRKFGENVLSLIDEVSRQGDENKGWLSRALDFVIKPRVSSREVASLDCAIKIAIIATANKLIEEGIQRDEWPKQIREASLFQDEEQAVNAVNESIRKYEEQGVSPQLISQLKIETGRFIGEPGESDVGGVNKVDAVTDYFRDLPEVFKDAQMIRSAAELSSDLFDQAERKWGPHETLPLTAHEYEVGILLALSGAKKEIVIAGFLHDVFEDYVEIDREEIRQRIGSKYGPRVLELIDSVTEPPKSDQPSNWWDRKRAVLSQILEGDSDMATLSCATKISTISAGNKFLRSGRDVNEWSRGTFVDNVTVFEQHLEVYKEKGVPEGLIQQYEIELRIFKQGKMEPAEYHRLRDSMVTGEAAGG